MKYRFYQARERDFFACRVQMYLHPTGENGFT